jgi:hypothetical protein
LAWLIVAFGALSRQSALFLDPEFAPHPGNVVRATSVPAACLSSPFSISLIQFASFLRPCLLRVGNAWQIVRKSHDDWFLVEDLRFAGGVGPVIRQSWREVHLCRSQDEVRPHGKRSSHDACAREICRREFQAHLREPSGPTHPGIARSSHHHPRGPGKLVRVTTKALHQAVKRNSDRFPEEFMFVLDAGEKLEVVTICDHLKQLKFSRAQPTAFTEHGAIMVATVLKTKRAVEMSVFVVRAFVELREMLVRNSHLARKLAELEQKISRHDKEIVSIVAA